METAYATTDQVIIKLNNPAIAFVEKVDDCELRIEYEPADAEQEAGERVLEFETQEQRDTLFRQLAIALTGMGR